MKKSDKSTYSDLVLRLVTEKYESNPNGVNQKELAVDITNTKNVKYTSVQPSVSKAVNELIKQKKITRTKDGTYIPFHQEHVRTTIKEQIKKTIVFSSGEVFSISETTLLLSVATDSLYQATELFKQYLGDSHCFNAVIFNQYVVLMMKGSESELRKIRADLENLVQESIAFHKKSKNKLRLNKNKPPKTGK